MAHHVRLMPLTRLDLVREVDAGWPQAEAGRRFRVSRYTVGKWLGRFQEEGAAGLEDRSSAPHGRPRRTLPELERRICAVRRMQGFGPHRIQWALAVARSTVYVVLRRRGRVPIDEARAGAGHSPGTPLDQLELGTKLLNRLQREGMHTVEDLLLRSDRELRAFGGFGEHSYRELCAGLRSHGFGVPWHDPVDLGRPPAKVLAATLDELTWTRAALRRLIEVAASHHRRQSENCAGSGGSNCTICREVDVARRSMTGREDRSVPPH